MSGDWSEVTSENSSVGWSVHPLAPTTGTGRPVAAACRLVGGLPRLVGPLGGTEVGEYRAVQ
jgi:hypothetical protein